MSCTIRALLLILGLSFCAQAETRTLALYVEPPRGLDAEADRIMRAELQRLLAPAGLEVVWKSLAVRNSGENFELLVVSSFEGSCTPEPVPSSPTAASLADTSISNGRILPFFRVDCTRVL